MIQLDRLDSGKLDRARGIVRELGSVLVAYSGGVDSTLLLKLALDELGGRAVAVLASSPAYPEAEQEQARQTAHALGARLGPGAGPRPRRGGPYRGRATRHRSPRVGARECRPGAARRGLHLRLARPRGLRDRQPEPDLAANLQLVAERGVVLALDEGTTGATAVAVGLDGEVRGKGYREIAQ